MPVCIVCMKCGQLLVTMLYQQFVLWNEFVLVALAEWKLNRTVQHCWPWLCTLTLYCCCVMPWRPLMLIVYFNIAYYTFPWRCSSKCRSCSLVICFWGKSVCREWLSVHLLYKCFCIMWIIISSFIRAVYSNWCSSDVLSKSSSRCDCVPLLQLASVWNQRVLERM